MSNFTIEGRMKSVPDVQRTWMWNLKIPLIRLMAPTASFTSNLMNDLIVRCKTISIPQRQNSPVMCEFLGMKQWFPGRPDIGGTITAMFEETEDQVITKCFYEWQERIFKVNPMSIRFGADIGIGDGSRKHNLSTNLYLSMYKYSGDNLNRNIVFVNAWPQQVSEVSLDYTSSDSVKYTVTFQYDYWILNPDPIGV